MTTFVAPRPVSFLLLLALTGGGESVLAQETKNLKGDETRVLFIGNSFTFVNDLPHQIKNIAESFNKSIYVDNSTIGGCTLYRQRAEEDERTASLLEEEWDYIVLQDYSLLPTITAAREKYLKPAISDFVSRKKSAKIVLYLTWGYNHGLTIDCPTSDTKGCFELGSLADLTSPPCASSKDYRKRVEGFECMGYAVARGYLDAMETVPGVDRVAPCGLAWQVVRGSSFIPSDCKASIDLQYSAALNLSLPLQVPGASIPGLQLYRVYPDGNVDKHPTVAGQYLNALVMYTTLFGSSPMGAAGPLDTQGPGFVPEKPLTQEQIQRLQLAAGSVVLDHKDNWIPSTRGQR